MGRDRMPESQVSDRIQLTLSTTPELRGIASLVLGGIGSRLDLPYERVDDLQLAVLSVLEAGTESSVTVEVDVGGSALEVAVGPLTDGVGSDAALTKVLDRLVDDVEETSRDGHAWLTLRLEHQQVE